MAVASSTIAIAALAVGVAGGVMQYQQQRQAGKAAQRAQDEQRKIQAEQRAQQASQAAAERRQQVREERVRRAQVQQGAVASGAVGSSGMLGAEGALSTNLSSNMGQNVGMVASAGRISQFSQAAADASSQSQRFSNNAALFGQISGFGANAFNQAGGFKTLGWIK